MGAYATVGHFTVCKGLERLCLEGYALIGRLTWITGYPKTGAAYRQAVNRRSELILRRHAAVTHRHFLDCTDVSHIGAFATITGYRTQFLTHSIDLRKSQQGARPVKIGDYCFMGTGCVILGGAELPNFSILRACSLLNKPFTQTYALYGGTPARLIRSLPTDYQYFCREIGFVL
jgi:acetyltransferase-like isoleucine patch superfamily enzyme